MLMSDFLADVLVENQQQSAVHHPPPNLATTALVNPGTVYGQEKMAGKKDGLRLRQEVT